MYVQCDPSPFAVNFLASVLLEVIADLPDRPLYIGEKVMLQFLVAVEGNGVSNLLFFSAVTVEEVPIPSQLEQSEPFVYNLTFYAASILNSSFVQVFVGGEIGEGITNSSFYTCITIYLCTLILRILLKNFPALSTKTVRFKIYI